MHAGDMDLDPERGQYRLSCTVPGVDANELRKTLGIRPPPYPVAGALRGILHCTGPLDQPVFAGAHQLAELGSSLRKTLSTPAILWLALCAPFCTAWGR